MSWIIFQKHGAKNEQVGTANGRDECIKKAQTIARRNGAVFIVNTITGENERIHSDGTFLAFSR